MRASLGRSVLPLLLTALLSPACNGNVGTTEPLPGTTGDLEVTVATTGATPDSDGYTVQVGSNSLPVDVGGSARFALLESGSYDVEMSGLAVNCSVVGANPKAAVVTAGRTETVTFEVSCPFALLRRLVYWENREDGYYYLVSVADDGSDPVDLIGGADLNVTEPAVHPDGTKVAFQGSGEVYVVNADGTGVRNLTEASGWDRAPAWSPDGQRIAFMSRRGGTHADAYDIFVMDADGGNQRRLTTHEAYDGEPTWSPDGTRIAFISHRSGDQELYVMNADGTLIEALTDDAAWKEEPDWGPHGKIVFAGLYNVSSNWDLYVVNGDGSELTRLSGDDKGRETTPAWSPDGKWIAFSRQEGNYAQFAVQVIDVGGTTRRDLTERSNEMVFWPDWSPH